MPYLFKTKFKYQKNRPVYGRIPIDHAPMQDLSINTKHMPMAIGGYQYLLVITCDQTNFTIVIPLRSTDAQSVAEAFARSFYCSQFGGDYVFVVSWSVLNFWGML